jgi:hypothetical protein
LKQNWRAPHPIVTQGIKLLSGEEERNDVIRARNEREGERDIGRERERERQIREAQIAAERRNQRNEDIGKQREIGRQGQKLGQERIDEERRRSLRLHANPVVEIRDEQKEYEQR